ncbi:unnamed protein product [Schistocephalus solidus]|uniref:Uncharacterized protein n=1 Tax=Schistocephalus solidus TaxID=70667 RepID=A0A183TLB7_SCHSO|nr:unnamed protein product [Schistocephalus solidus]
MGSLKNQKFGGSTVASLAETGARVCLPCLHWHAQCGSKPLLMGDLVRAFAYEVIGRLLKSFAIDDE